VEEPLYSYGKLIGTRRRYNDRLLMFILRNRAPERFAEGAPKGLNAVSKMQLDKLKQEWRAEWEAGQRKVTPAEVRASIDRKIEAIRVRLEGERVALWARLSEETRAAWDRFAELRARDCASWEDQTDAQSILAITPNCNPPTVEPPGPRRTPEVKAPKRAWGLKDEDFGKP
jgi:hypothetical protein